MNAIRYARAPSEALMHSLEDGLLAPLRQDWEVNELPLDLQLREHDTVHLYCGLTRLLEATLTQGVVHCSAHPTYTKQPCARPLMRRWRLDEPGLEGALSSYLAKVKVGRQWTNKEGSVQAAWMDRQDPLIPIDREAVIGGGADSYPQVDAAVTALWPHVRDWARLDGPKAANEVDLLGLDPEGRVAVVELKHGGAKADAIYYAPLQALRYAWEWADRLERLLPELEALVRAKQRLGMLPATLPTLRPELRVLVAWGGAEPSWEVRRRTQRVRAALRPYLPPGVADIELWDEDDQQL